MKCPYCGRESKPPKCDYCKAAISSKIVTAESGDPEKTETKTKKKEEK